MIAAGETPQASSNKGFIMIYEEIIECYNDLREKCLEIAKRDNGKLMESDAWLCWAIQESDITLDYSNQGIHCHGSAYTTQTMGTELFSFVIPFSELED
jgi:hypothetical protein